MAAFYTNFGQFTSSNLYYTAYINLVTLNLKVNLRIENSFISQTYKELGKRLHQIFRTSVSGFFNNNHNMQTARRVTTLVEVYDQI